MNANISWFQTRTRTEKSVLMMAGLFLTILMATVFYRPLLPVLTWSMLLVFIYFSFKSVKVMLGSLLLLLGKEATSNDVNDDDDDVLGRVIFGFSFTIMSLVCAHNSKYIAENTVTWTSNLPQSIWGFVQGVGEFLSAFLHHAING